MITPSTQRVTICIATCNRERQLRELLASIRDVELPPRVDLEVVVVDNGDLPLTASEATLGDIAGTRLRLLREPIRGISQARNRAVTAALPADFVVFVDDDELVSPSWLAELLAVHSDNEADVVTGPVLPTFPQGAPRWAVESRVFERPRRPTGSRMGLAAAGNTMVRASVFTQMESWFDEALGLSGGEDSEFFERVHERGFTIVWADAALVTEEVAAERLRIRWVLKRAYRIGIGMAQRADRREPRRRIERALHHAARAAWLLLTATITASRSRPEALVRLSEASRAAGRAAGHIGLTFEEYK